MFKQALSLSLLLAGLQTATACVPEHASNSSDAFTLGTDGPADPETLGYTVNHFALVSNNLTATQAFYGDVLGMRHVFTYRASADYTVMYMAYAAGGKNGTGFQSGAELYAQKNNAEGYIEFVSVKDPEKPAKSSADAPNTFSHIGLIVPDVAKTQDRLQRMGAKIVKPVGEKPSFPGPIANAFGLADPAEADKALQGIVKLGFTRFLIAADPDGNLLEIQQQVDSAA